MGSLAGQLLMAMPQMTDPYFSHSVVYLCAHAQETGAMGLIVNKTFDLMTLDEIYAQLKIVPVAASVPPQAVHFGGPVAPGQSIILHSSDYREGATVDVGGAFATTATRDIFHALAQGEGPNQYLVTLGYAGWGPGQLEAEIQANGWLSVAADAGLVFAADNETKWQRALAKLGVNPQSLSGESGHA